ncbi:MULTISPECIES: hypothetical protein [unclassified Spiroplasma]|uniref:hypothetical protein n=1 Tax=unclassified Spiroplasma TaxID=2637901 RepID=UPI0030D1622F
MDKNDNKGEIDYKIHLRNKKEIYCELTDSHLLSNRETKKFRKLLSTEPLIGALEFVNKQNYSFLITNIIDCIKNKKNRIINKNMHLSDEKWLLVNILTSPLNYQYIKNEQFLILKNNLKKYHFNEETLSLINKENNNFFKRIIINLKYGTIKNNIYFIQEIYLILDFNKQFCKLNPSCSR